jgi:hypothetical protein
MVRDGAAHIKHARLAPAIAGRIPRSLEGWRLPGVVYEDEEALANGRPVVTSARMLRALNMAGLDSRPYGFGGSEYGKCWLLDENDRLTEIDEAEL